MFWCIDVRTDALTLVALLTVSPLMFVGMVISVVDIVRTRKRGPADRLHTRFQWVGLALMAGAMPIWFAIAIVVASLP